MSIAYLGVDAAQGRTGLVLVRDGRVLRFTAVVGAPRGCSPSLRVMREAWATVGAPGAAVVAIERPVWHKNPHTLGVLCAEGARWSTLAEDAGQRIVYVEARIWQGAIGCGGTMDRRRRAAHARRYAEGALGLPSGLGDDEVAAACIAAWAEVEDRRAVTE